jgi:type II secretory pathway component PulM
MKKTQKLEFNKNTPNFLLLLQQGERRKEQAKDELRESRIQTEQVENDEAPQIVSLSSSTPKETEKKTGNKSLNKIVQKERVEKKKVGQKELKKLKSKKLLSFE